ncbi:hypothetical protein HYFRA_00004443 [Hymenoscyphus fraxineus]|uniref:Uncharacterized protein n=1 Tax=Hymenoscyphus fraxineus TaxID=746836 RepID=A0A9N9PIJ7_9HELO|nr:hypothetical protein HYFRA_00004443 [Hymenoscyphus fraxineus]
MKVLPDLAPVFLFTGSAPHCHFAFEEDHSKNCDSDDQAQRVKFSKFVVKTPYYDETREGH